MVSFGQGIVLRRYSSIGRPLVNWYTGTVLLVLLGILIGSLVFFFAGPGRPKIGVIDIPFTVINDDSSFVISAFLDYARYNDSIKAVVIRLNSPGGGAAASEQLYYQTRKLREKKPVVVVMTDIVASGGYMMSMGASYTYAKPSSLVGSVGVIMTFPGEFIPSPPREQVMPTGPFKLSGGGRRHFVSLTDQLKQSFAHIVISERGSKLKLSRNELLEAKIYSGVESANSGLVDALGGDGDAMEKAAQLAGVSNYGLVDVNTEVFRAFSQQVKRIVEPLLSDSDGAASSAMMGLIREAQGPDQSTGEAGDRPQVEILRRYLLSSGIGVEQEQALPGFPLTVNGPNFYYLYVGQSQ